VKISVVTVLDIFLASSVSVSFLGKTGFGFIYSTNPEWLQM